jgi:hypothetical protein
MSDFRTVIHLPNAPFLLDYSDGFVAYGSCFAENMSDKLKWFRFNIIANSHGIIFNPFSVANAMRDVLSNRIYKLDDLVQVGEIFHSMNHHGKFSSVDASEVVQAINENITEMRIALKRAKVLLITFGTAWYYQYKRNNSIVANCHKIPGTEFDKRLANHHDISNDWSPLIQDLLAFNPDLQIVFTVSPVRHLRDGFHENQLSKANLLIAVNNLVSAFKGVHYFPAYELMMDDLRDYRFCNEDMVHPSSEAVNYIWEKFKLWCFNQPTLVLLQKMLPLLKYIDHRPLKTNHEKHTYLINQKEIELIELIAKFNSNSKN